MTLNGKKSEALYQLGLSESKNFHPNLEMLERLVQTKSPAINRILQTLGQTLLKQTRQNRHNQTSNELLRAYAEGLGVSFEKVALAYFLPELASSLSKWLPGLPVNLLGCSSFLAWSEISESPFHGRILDFPLVGSFDRLERVLHTRFEGELAVCSLSSSGLPFHSLTAINEAGVTMALHQKFTPSFHPDGESIFSLASDLIARTTSYKALSKLIKEKKSITTWNLIFTFPDGRATSIDISGSHYVEQTFDLKQGEQYLCNFAPTEIERSNLYQPLGINSYNQMRAASAHRKFKKFNPQKSSEVDLLKIMSTLKLKKGESAKKFELDCLTPSSLHTVVMNGKKSTLHANSGIAPKLFCSQYAVIEAQLSDPRARPTLSLKGKLKEPSLPERGYRHIIDAQVAYDRLDKHGFYHHLQMAIGHFHELEIKIICEFFFQIALFLDTTHMKERHMILSELTRMRELLPPYLRDMCTLYILRLERLTQSSQQNSSQRIKEISHPGLVLMAQAEEKIPPPILAATLSKTAVIRLDLLDVIHPHLRLDT